MQRSGATDRTTGEETPAREAARSVVCAVLLAVAFLVAQWPLALVMRFHHPDERHYTDAAMLMVESGDYLTPRRYDGEPRPQKPLAQYWAVACSYRCLGVSPVAARLPSLLAGAALLLLVHRLARVTTERPAAAALAVALLATQYTFVLCANRTTPDILLTLALTLGFIGLAEQLRAATLRVGPLLTILSGAALAVATKGLLGVVFLAFAVWSLAGAPHLDARRYRHAAGMVLAAWIAAMAGWLALMGHSHGTDFIAGFLYDQVVGRFVVDRWWHKPLNVAGYLALLPALFLPWWPWLPARRLVRDLRDAASGRASAATTRGLVERAFVAWMLLCAFIFGLGNKLTGRYILSAAPLLAVLLADAMASVDGGAAPAVRRHAVAFEAACAAVAALAVVSIPVTGGPLGTQVVPAVCTAVVLALALLARRTSPSRVAAPVGWSALALAILPLVALVLHAPFTRAIEQELPEVLATAQEDPATRGPVLCHLHPSVLARARLHLGHFLPTVPAQDVGTNAVPDNVRARLVSELAPTPVEPARFETVREYLLPVASSKELRRFLASRPDAALGRVAGMLRDGYPRIVYRLEARVAQASDEDPADAPR